MSRHSHGSKRTARKATTTTATKPSVRASNSTANGRTSVKMALIARDLMVGNPKLAEMGLSEQAQGHKRSRRVFRASVNGPITFPTATSWKRSSIRRSTGTESEHPTSSPPKTTHSTRRRCCLATC